MGVERHVIRNQQVIGSAPLVSSIPFNDLENFTRYTN
jgi:hypothetical protein